MGRDCFHTNQQNLDEVLEKERKDPLSLISKLESLKWECGGDYLYCGKGIGSIRIDYSGIRFCNDIEFGSLEWVKLENRIINRWAEMKLEQMKDEIENKRIEKELILFRSVVDKLSKYH